jgi:hypothetical protein
MPRLLVGVCIAHINKHPLSVTDAFTVMDARHGRTASRYISLAESQGLIQKVRDPMGDARKTILVPTERLQRYFAEQMSQVVDAAKQLIAAIEGVPDSRLLTGKSFSKRSAGALAVQNLIGSPIPAK